MTPYRVPRGRPLTAVLLAAIVLIGAAGLVSPAYSQQSVSIVDNTVDGLAPVTMEVVMTTTEPTEGFVLAIGFDESQVNVTDVSVDGTETETAGAE